MKQKKQKWMSLISLVLILVPLLALTSYAAVNESSEIIYYSFTYGGLEGVKTAKAVKADVGEATAGSAGITVTDGRIVYGHIIFWVNNDDGLTVTNVSKKFTQIDDNDTLYYHTYSGMYPKCTVTLYGKATDGVTGVGGYFQP